jgi:hypothetical protein
MMQAILQVPAMLPTGDGLLFENYRNHCSRFYPRVAFLTRGYYYLTTSWSVAANGCVPKSIRHSVITFYRNGKEGFAKGRKGFLASLFLEQSFFFSFPCFGQKPESPVSFLTPSGVPLMGLPLCDHYEVCL